MLWLRHPALCQLSCTDCQLYVIGENYRVEEKNGKPLKRPDGRKFPKTQAPCRVAGMGCPKGTPEKPKTLNARNVKAYQHFKQCRATGHWPDDAIVRQNAAIIVEAEETVKAALAERQNKMMEVFLGVVHVVRG